MVFCGKAETIFIARKSPDVRRETDARRHSFGTGQRVE